MFAIADEDDDDEEQDKIEEETLNKVQVDGEDGLDLIDDVVSERNERLAEEEEIAIVKALVESDKHKELKIEEEIPEIVFE